MYCLRITSIQFKIWNIPESITPLSTIPLWMFEVGSPYSLLK